MNKINIKKGFTLIELLVVISIIGIMSSIVLSALNDARAKARDAQRIQSLKEIQKALTLYYDENETYPIYTDDWGIISTNAADWSNLAIDLSSYISPLPQDPINNLSTFIYTGPPRYAYMYRSNSQGDKYDLIAFFETNNSLRCAVNDWFSDAGLSTSPFWGNPDYWCTSSSFPYAWINNRDNIYDTTR